MENATSSIIMTPFLCFFGLFNIIWCLMGLVSLVGFVFWIFMLIDVIRRKDKAFPGESKDQKLLWLLLIIFSSYIGAFIYYFMVYRKEGAAK